MADYSDERRSLYERFKASSADRNTDEYFDEDDLIEIFDYASDSSDDFVRIEVLQQAARRCPDSVALAERKAFFYMELGNEEGARQTASALPEDSFMRGLLLLRLDRPSDEEASARLDRLVESVSDFEDEWLIQLAATATELGLTKWLLDSKEKVCARSQFPQTYIYELVSVAENASDLDTAVALSEELTSLEPLTADFWVILASFHGQREEYDKSLAAVEYALAIDPDSVRALMIKAEAMKRLGDPVDAVIPLLDRASSLAPDDMGPVTTKVSVYCHHGMMGEALDALETFRRSHPDNLEAVRMMVEMTDGMLRSDMIDPVVGNDTLFPLNDCVTLAEGLKSLECYGAEAQLLTSLARTRKIYLMKEAMEALYKAGRYSEAVDFYEERLAMSGVPDGSAVVQLLYVLSLLRIGRKEGIEGIVSGAIAVVESAILSDTFVGLEEKMASRQVAGMLRDIAAQLRAGEFPHLDGII